MLRIERRSLGVVLIFVSLVFAAGEFLRSGLQGQSTKPIEPESALLVSEDSQNPGSFQILDNRPPAEAIEALVSEPHGTEKAAIREHASDDQEFTIVGRTRWSRGAGEISAVIVRPVASVQTEGLSDLPDSRAKAALTSGSTEPDSDGRFSISGVRRGQYELVGRLSSEHTELLRGNVRLDTISTVDVGTIHVAPHYRVSGKARVASGIMNSFARVYLLPVSVTEESVSSKCLQATWSCRTDPDGAFVIDGVREGRYRCISVAEGHWLADYEVDVVQDVELDVLHRPQGSMLLTVVAEESGVPVEAVTLSIEQQEFVLGGHRLPKLADVPSLSVTARPGHYVVSRISTPLLSAKLLAPGRRPTMLSMAGAQPGEAVERTVVMPRQCAARFSVVDEQGAARPGVSLGFVESGAVMRRELLLACDAKGQLETLSIFAGQWEVTVYEEGVPRHVYSVAVDSGCAEAPVVLLLTTMGGLRLVSSEGSGVGSKQHGWALQLDEDHRRHAIANSARVQDRSAEPAALKSGLTDRLGGLRLLDLHPGRYRLAISPWDEAAAQVLLATAGVGTESSLGLVRDVEIRPGVESEISYELWPESRLYGVATSSHPVTVFLTQAETSAPTSAGRPLILARQSVAADGGYEFLGVASGSYVVFFQQAGVPCSVARRVLIRPSRDERIDVTLSSAVVRGQVLEQSTRNVCGGVVLETLPAAAGVDEVQPPLSDTESSPSTAQTHSLSNTTTSGADGRFEIYGLEVGTYLLRTVGGEVSGHAYFSVPAAGLPSAADVLVEITAGGHLWGHVSIDEGVNTDDLSVFLIVEGNQMDVAGIREGRYEFRGLKPGNYGVRVINLRTAQMGTEASGVVRAGDTTRVDL